MFEGIIEVSIYTCVFVAVVLMTESIYSYVFSKTTYKKKTNRRLKIVEKVGGSEEALIELRRQRSLTKEGRYVLPVIWFNRLLVQSGISIGAPRALVLMIVLALVGYASVFILNGRFSSAMLASIMFGFVLPVLLLGIVRRRRLRRIEEQLPEALDVMKRSLLAGHPVAVAISMVGREMPDPIGSEFGMSADEMTYGLDLESALRNMGARVGQPDLLLMVTAVSIQSKTGGNLTELLGRLGAVIRDRQTLRRKVRALSAEGRFSAIGLSALPIILFVVLLVIAPKFYGEIWQHPWVEPTLAFAAVLMVAGDIVLYRMVNFKF